MYNKKLFTGLEIQNLIDHQELTHFSLFWGLLLLPEMVQSGENTGQHACQQIDDRQQVSQGAHFMDLLVT